LGFGSVETVCMVAMRRIVTLPVVGHPVEHLPLVVFVFHSKSSL
jgi:hypothetical protein